METHSERMADLLLTVEEQKSGRVTWGSKMWVPILGPLCIGCFLICKVNIVLILKIFFPKVDMGN